jgi:hypothetical protein
MSQISISVLKQGLKYSKVISCSFFTMKDSYRNFGKYQSHLGKFLEQVRRYLRQYEVRIYTDNTGAEFAVKISQEYPDVSVLHFNCPEFREGLGHIGTFGTLVRFLPLFERHSLVWISDIDVPDNYFAIENFHDDFRIVSQICYDRKVYARKYTFVAGRFISRHQLPRALLTRFLNKILNGDYANEIQELNQQNSRKPPSQFPYGTDELFMNWSVYDWIKRYDFSINVLIDYTPGSIVTMNAGYTQEEADIIYNFYKTGNKNLIPSIKKTLKEKLPIAIEKYPCLKPFLEKLDLFKNDFYERFKLSSSEL